MAEKHDSLAGKLLDHVRVHNAGIIDNEIPAAALGEKDRLGVGSAVAAMIVGTHDNPLSVSLPCEAIITANMLAHPVE